MKRKITIGNFEMTISGSVFTLIAYQNRWDRPLIKELTDLADKIGNIDEANADMGAVSDYLQTMLQITYTMYDEANKEALPYDEWLGQLEGILASTEWMKEVYVVAYSIFQGNL